MGAVRNALPPAPSTPPPSALASSEAGHPAPHPRLLPIPSEWRDRSGWGEGGGGSLAWALARSPLPSSLLLEGGAGGVAAGALASMGAGDSAASSLLRGE